MLVAVRAQQAREQLLRVARKVALDRAREIGARELAVLGGDCGKGLVPARAKNLNHDGLLGADTLDRMVELLCKLQRLRRDQSDKEAREIARGLALEIVDKQMTKVALKGRSKLRKSVLGHVMVGQRVNQQVGVGANALHRLAQLKTLKLDGSAAAQHTKQRLAVVAADIVFHVLHHVGLELLHIGLLGLLQQSLVVPNAEADQLLVACANTRNRLVHAFGDMLDSIAERHEHISERSRGLALDCCAQGLGRDLCVLCGHGDVVHDASLGQNLNELAFVGADFLLACAVQCLRIELCAVLVHRCCFFAVRLEQREQGLFEMPAGFARNRRVERLLVQLEELALDCGDLGV
eukprot:comp21818_c0_seq3/m.49122 comp21818_c0_seq3/g.49122  ORF comp21818_c0_seq3/g.49122 comp21818_c0_seq3/m.49122 type:complete len:350 (-) comp21818_c0_seq3:358-1407(-)